MRWWMRGGTAVAIVLILVALSISPAPVVNQAPEPTGVTTGFPVPAKAGFHHAALMYGGPKRTTETVQRYVAHRRGDRPVRDGWLFDAFVELAFNAPSQECTDYGKTTSGDWLSLLGRWFGTGPAATLPRGEVGQLDEAIAATAAELAHDGRPMGAPPKPRQLVIAMPWPSPLQRSFGMIDGQPADLSKLDDRVRVVGWYARQVKAAFAKAGLRHLSLWGLYFMREDAAGPDGDWMAEATESIRAEGLRSLWIPYWNAPGVEQAADRGVDVTVLQPSAAFSSPIDGGRVSASRLRAAAKVAAKHGVGIEIEVRGGGANTDDRRLLKQYLSAGHSFGYQRGVSAWFLGWNPTPFDPLPNGTDNPSYHDVADYIMGIPVADDDLHAAWKFEQDPSGATVATAAFAPRGDLRALRLDFAAPWAGLAKVQAHTAAGWAAAGWAAYRPPRPGDEQSLAVPLASRAGVDGLRVSFEGVAGAKPRLATLTGDTLWRLPKPAAPDPVTLSRPATYPDVPASTETAFAPGKLTNGHWSDKGWQSGHQVGWESSGDTRVIIDLWIPQPVEEIVLHTHAAGPVGITWPVAPVALLSTTCAATVDAGVAAPPCPLLPVPGGEVEVTGQQSADNQAGVVRFTAPAGTKARWVSVVVSSAIGWTMLDEIEVRAAGRNIAQGAWYHVAPPAARPRSARMAPCPQLGW